MYVLYMYVGSRRSETINTWDHLIGLVNSIYLQDLQKLSFIKCTEFLRRFSTETYFQIHPNTQFNILYFIGIENTCVNAKMYGVLKGSYIPIFLLLWNK